jgi:tetratricopeptide (TPR) repeat protein
MYAAAWMAPCTGGAARRLRAELWHAGEMTKSAGGEAVWDFFVSYSEADRAWAEWVSWQLEDDGHKVLVQAWDVVAGVSWVHQMHEVVQRAERTVVVLSPRYLDSPYGTAEWQAAWRADPLGEQRKLVVVRIADCERPGLLATVVSVDLFGVAPEIARARLLQTVAHAITGRGKPVTEPRFPPFGEREPRFPGSLPEIWNLPPRNTGFIARSDELAHIQASLAGRSLTTVQAVRGMGGVGKTQTAIEYAYRNASRYDLVWWVDAENPTLIPGQYALLGAELGLPATMDAEATVRAVVRELRRRRDWLVILDNAEDIADIRRLLPEGGHVLITTRRGGYRALGPVLDLDVFTREQAVALLRRRAPHLSAADAHELAGRLGDLPLALAQAGAYLDHSHLPATTYLALMDSHARQLFERGAVVDNRRRVATLWSIALERLLADHPAAVQLLQLCAWLGPEPIPTDLITSTPALLPGPLAGAAADPVAMADTIGALVDYSLLRRTHDGLLVHRLVQAVARYNPPPTPDWTPADTAQSLLRADLGDPDEPANWARWRTLLPHVLAATGNGSGADTAWLIHRAAEFTMMFSSDFAPARPLLLRALHIRENLFGVDHESVAATLASLAHVENELGEFDAMHRNAERAGYIFERLRGPDHPDTVTARIDVGFALIQLGRIGAARSHFAHALAIYEPMYGRRHRRTGGALIGLAHMHTALGEFDAARPLLEEALRIRQDVWGADHPYSGILQTYLGGVLIDIGDATGAVPMLAEALRIREAAYGGTSPAVGHALVVLGRALRELGDTAAVRLLERSLEIHERFYGSEHTVTASVLLELGLATGARALLERALRIRVAAFGPEHPWTATVADRLAGRPAVPRGRPPR